MYCICHERGIRWPDARLPGLAPVDEVAGGRRPGRRAAGLTHAQYSILASLLGMQRAGLRPSQRQLADHTGLEPLYVSKLARTLEAAGLIERAGDPADARAVQLSLTAHGRDVTRRAIAVVRQLPDQLLAPLGGLGGRRTEVFVRELRALLDAPLDSGTKE